MKKQYYGRKRTLDNGEEEYQFLLKHLSGTAELAKEYASAFTSEKMGELEGILHDIGKYKEAFQEHLKNSDTSKVDHSSAGAFVAMELSKRYHLPYYALLSYSLASHHSGLLDYGSSEREGACLYHRLQKSRQEAAEFAAWETEVTGIPVLEREDVLLKPGKLRPPKVIAGEGTAGQKALEREQAERRMLIRSLQGLSLAIYTRFLFSCLVDADRTDAANFGGERRERKKATLAELKHLFDTYMKRFIGDGEKRSRINEIRTKILNDCLSVAENDQGIYSLSVPTGGGKTYASMGFALRHGIRNGCRRIVYALPFTSIIEQNAAEYREIFGPENVLENHSNYQNPFLKNEDLSERMKLAAENWDVPIIVTTNVQLFETLFSDKPSKLRKLHNLAGSVIVLDEAQAIPNEFVKPCMAALEELVRNYGCSVVLCTATQPGFDRNEVFPTAVTIQEIVPEHEAIAVEMKRVESRFVGKKSTEEIADIVKQSRQILTIVNTKRHARQIFEMCSESCDGLFHLSTDMYPVHRRQVIQMIRDRLKDGEPCRVVSTQLIEAGVNLDFPLAYRSLCGVDSAIQAAGRCNREGKLQELGRMFVFEPEEKFIGKGYLALTAEIGRLIMGKYTDILSKEASDDYFRELFDIRRDQLDKAEVLRDCGEALAAMSAAAPWPQFEFETMARKFKLIEESGTSVVIPIEKEAKELLRQAEYAESLNSIARKLAPYTVNVREQALRELEKLGVLKMQSDSFLVLWDTKNYYDKKTGLKTTSNDCFDYIIS